MQFEHRPMLSDTDHLWTSIFFEDFHSDTEQWCGPQEGMHVYGCCVRFENSIRRIL